MKTLTTGFLMLVTMYGQVNADNHPATGNKITLSLDNTSEVSSAKGSLPRLRLPRTISNWSGMNWQICGLLSQRSNIR